MRFDVSSRRQLSDNQSIPLRSISNSMERQFCLCFYLRSAVVERLDGLLHPGDVDADAGTKNWGVPGGCSLGGGAGPLGPVAVGHQHGGVGASPGGGGHQSAGNIT